MTEEPGQSCPFVPWGGADIFLILILFFCLPGWVTSALGLIPETFRERYLTIQPSEAADLFDSENDQDSASGGSAAVRSSNELPKTLIPKRFVQLTRDISSSLHRKKSQRPKEGEILRGEHPLTVLMVTSSRIPRFHWVLFLCFFTAVITAPLAEEFVFRVVFQRGLERYIPYTFPVILIPALCFAAIHIRQPEGMTQLAELNRILCGIIASAFSHLFLILIAAAWLRGVRGASFADFGWTKKRFVRSLFLGVGNFLLVFPLILILQQGLHQIFPDTVLDPVPIFVLAVGLGLLFRRTNRFAAIFAMHASLNLTSFFGIFWMIQHNFF